MLKRIPVDQVRLGMFLHSLEGNWLSHPFWKSQFLLRDEADVAALRRSGVQAVLIDVARGLDAETAAAPASEPAAEPQAAVAARPATVPHGSVSARDEYRRAAQVLNRSALKVKQLYDDARLGRAIDSAACGPVVEDITASVTRNASALIGLARLKDKDRYTYLHSVAVCALMVAVARELALDEDTVRDAGLAGLLHDIGKVAMPEAILNKPGRLTDAEFEVMRSHPEQGHRLLLAGGWAHEATLDVCLHHHEKFDGSGYPHRLQGESIGLLARMGAICDVYDAVTSNRPYKKAWEAADSIATMATWKGHFDPKVFGAFVKTVGIYPLGSLVRLESGRLAVVAEQNPDKLTQPCVNVFFSTRSGQPIPALLLDLSREGAGDRIVAREDPQAWGLGDLRRLWQ